MTLSGIILLMTSGWMLGVSTVGYVAEDLPRPSHFSFARYTQERRLAALDRPLRSSGTVTFTNEGFVWLQQSPFHTSLSYDGATITERLLVNDQAIDRIVNDPVTIHLTRTLFGILSGSWINMQTHFEIKILGHDDATGWSLRLKPRDNAVRRVMPHVLLRGGRYVEEILIEQAGGDTTVIHLTGHRSAE